MDLWHEGCTSQNNIRHHSTEQDLTSNADQGEKRPPIMHLASRLGHHTLCAHSRHQRDCVLCLHSHADACYGLTRCGVQPVTAALGSVQHARTNSSLYLPKHLLTPQLMVLLLLIGLLIALL